MSNNQQGNSLHHQDVASQAAATPFRSRSSARLKAALPAEDTGYDPFATDEEVDYEDYEDDQEYAEGGLAEHHKDPSTDELPVTGSHGATASRYEGWAMIFTGCMLIMAAFAVLANHSVAKAPSKTLPAMDTLSTMGITPGLMIMLGIILVLASRLASRLRDLQHGVEDHVDWAYESNYQTTADLDFLVESQETMDERGEGSDQDVKEVLSSMARQHKQLTNLGKALRMYGKPLAEVHRRVAEVAELTKSTAADLETFKKSVQADLEATTRKIVDDMTSLKAQIPSDDDLTLFAQEARAIGTRLTKEISQLMEAQGGNSASEGIADLRSEIDAMQAAVRGMTSELASRSESNQAPGCTAEQSSSPSSIADLEFRESGSLGHAMTGSRKSGDDTVLGAIAKLKQMRP